MAKKATNKKLTRRQFIAGAASAGVGLAVAACSPPITPTPAATTAPKPAQPTQPAATQPAPATTQTTTLKMQASWPASSLLYESFTMWAGRVDKCSGGRLKIQVQPGGAVVPALEVLDATHKGIIDGAHTWPGYWLGKHRAAVLFRGGPGGPFGMDVLDHLGWMYEGGGWDLYQEFYNDILKLDVIAFPAIEAGPQSQGWFKKPIKNWDEFRGIKYRIPEVAGEIFKEAGMTVVTLAGSEILPAAERGVIDAAEWVAPAEDGLALGFADVFKYHLMPGIHEQVTIGELIINKAVWNKLAPDLQEIIKATLMETFVLWWVRFLKKNAEAMGPDGELKKKGVTIIRTPDDVLLKVLELWDKISAADAAKDPFYKKVLESKRKYAELVVPAHRQMFIPYEFAANYYWKP